MTKGIRFKAVLIGLVVDFGGSLLLGLVLGISMAIVYAIFGVPASELASRLDPSHSLPMEMATLVLGAIASLIAGFTAGWMAKFHEIKNSALMGLISVLLTLPFCGSYPAWYTCAAAAVTFLPAIAGGYIAKVVFKGDAVSPVEA